MDYNKLYSQAIQSMVATLDSQNDPKVGIFWYSQRFNDLFGVVAIDAKSAPSSGFGGLRTCKELHKTVWAKEWNKAHHHNVFSPFQGDYKDTPRGRVFYDDEIDEYYVFHGSWWYDIPNIMSLVKEEFNLNNQIVHEVNNGHWDIGSGFEW